MEKESVINNRFKAHNDELRMDLLKGYIYNKGDYEGKWDELGEEDDENDVDERRELGDDEDDEYEEKGNGNFDDDDLEEDNEDEIAEEDDID